MYKIANNPYFETNSALVALVSAKFGIRSVFNGQIPASKIWVIAKILLK